MRVIRPETNFDEPVEPGSGQLYAAARTALERMRTMDLLQHDSQACMYVYRLETNSHAQTGLVATCNVTDYERGVIKQHELTRSDKEQDRVSLIEAINLHAGLVFLAYRDEPDIDSIIEQACMVAPWMEFESEDGVRHSVWRVSAPQQLIKRFDTVPCCYIADGHHRASAASIIGAKRRADDLNHTGEEEYDWFASVLFPAGQLKILPYNRLVADLGGLTEEEYVTRLAKVVSVSPSSHPSPDRPGRVRMYLGNSWHDLRFSNIPDDPVTSLDVSLLQTRILSPLLGIENPRTDPRISFVGGNRPATELARLVDTGEAAVAFSMYPVSMDQIMRIADTGAVMPPKSTWFEPKLRSGLLMHEF